MTSQSISVASSRNTWTITTMNDSTHNGTTSSFRLISAHLAESKTRGVAGQPSQIMPERKGTFSSSQDRTETSHVSVLIGNNGTGKSHLFSAIAETFYLLGQKYVGPKIPLKLLHYRLNGIDCICRRVSGNRIELLVSGVQTEIEKFPLPSRVVALTLTPFDKFPQPKREHWDEFHPRFIEQLYRYLGTRDGTNRSSIFSLLYKSVENIASYSSNSFGRQPTKIDNVLDYLGYKPKITLLYARRAYQAKILALSKGEKTSQGGIFDEQFDSRLRTILNRYQIGSNEMSQYASSILEEFSKEMRHEINIDLQNMESDSNIFRELNIFRQLRVLRLESVVLEKKSGHRIDLKKASSGELSIVTAFLALSTEIVEGSLVLIDEPEISLHPEWQSDFMSLLVNTFSDFTGSHFAIATHSPLILSDVDMSSAFVFSMDTSRKINLPTVAGKSPDELLLNAFRVDARNNLYLKELVISALRLIADQKTDSREFHRIRRELQSALGVLPSDDPRALVVQGIVNVDREALH